MLTPVYIRSTPLDTTDLRGYLRGTNYGSTGYYFLHGYEWIWMDVNIFGMGNTWIVCWINAGIRHAACFCVSCCVMSCRVVSWLGLHAWTGRGHHGRVNTAWISLPSGIYNKA